MANSTGDQLTAGTDANSVALVGAPFGGGNSLSFSAYQVIVAGFQAGGGKLPTNPNGAGYDQWIGAGDAGATGRGGNIYFQVGLQNTSGGNGSFIFLDQTGTTIFSISALGVWASTVALTIGSASTDKVSFYGATAIVQPTTSVASATIVNGVGTAGKQDDTYDGYTVAKVVKALRNLGILA